MPIEYRIEPDRRLVRAWATGVLSDSDLFGFQKDVWSRPEVTGFDELFDLTGVSSVESAMIDRAREFAAFAASMDSPHGAGRLAIVAPQDYFFALGRMYEAYRELNPRSTRRVSVCRTLDEALAFLGLEPPL